MSGRPSAAEAAVLAAALDDPIFASDLVDLPPDLFASDAARRLRLLLNEAIERGEKPTAAVILARHPNADAFLRSLPAPSPEALGVLWEEWMRSEARRIGAMLQAANGDVAQAVERAKDSLDALSLRRAKRSKHVGEVAREIIDDDAQPEPVLLTGIEKLDSLLGAASPTDLVVLGARPAIGKSTLALQIALEVAQSGGGVVLFTLEMAERLVVTKALSYLTRLDFEDIVNRRVDKGVLQGAQELLAEMPFKILDDGGVTVRDIRAEVRRIQHIMPVSLAIVDYLQIVRPVKEHQSREREVREISNGLKQVAKELGVVVLALAQIRRGADEKEPALDALRESGAIEADADMVVFIHRDGPAAKISLAKNRRGSIGEVRVRFNGAQGRFAAMKAPGEGVLGGPKF